MRVTSAASAASAPEAMVQKNSRETLAGMDARPAVNGPCPDDCHYCWGPETD